MDFVELIPTHEFLTKGHSSNSFTRDFYLSETSAILEESGINLKRFLSYLAFISLIYLSFQKVGKLSNHWQRHAEKNIVLLKSSMKMER